MRASLDPAKKTERQGVWRPLNPRLEVFDSPDQAPREGHLKPRPCMSSAAWALGP